MWWSSASLILLLVTISGAASGAGNGYVVGLGTDVDTAGGRAVSIFADYGLGENTWLSAGIATAHTGGLVNLDTTYADMGIDHWFDPVGVRASVAYWGDADLLDSVDLRGAFYLRNDRGALSLDYERRDFNFTFDSSLTDVRRTAEFYADGIGLSGRLNATKNLSIFLGGMRYDYSRDINLQERTDILDLFSLSRLSLMNSLLDYRVSGWVERRYGLAAVDLRVETWQTAIDKGRVNSIGLGMLTPVSGATDMEFRFAYDDSENFGSTISFSVFMYYFGL